MKIVSNILKKAHGRKFEKEWMQFIDFIVIIPYGIIRLNYLKIFIWTFSKFENKYISWPTCAKRLIHVLLQIITKPISLKWKKYMYNKRLLLH